MPPPTNLAGILDSPVASSNGSTVMGYHPTLPDISLGSLGSSFHSDDEFERERERERDAQQRGRDSDGARGNRRSHLFTPLAAAPASALLNVSPSSVRRGEAPRRSRYLRREDGENDDTISTARYTSTNNTHSGLVSDDDDGVLGQLSVNVSHDRRSSTLGSASTSSTTTYGGGPSKRSGRHSVAAGANPMTLREQEQNVDALQKENFNLQLENHFLKERLASMAPDHIEAALNENVKLKIEILNLSKELKKAKKLLSQQDRDLNAAARERGNRRNSFDSRQLEAMYRDEKERRINLESDLDRNADRVQELEGELETARAKLEDQGLEMANLQDAVDRAEDELDKLREEAKGLGDSVGLGKGREARMVQKLEQDNVDLKAELEELRANARADLDELEDQVNELRDKHASAQIDLDRRDEEIEDLNNEIDAKIQEHEKEIQHVEAEWRDEVLEARAQADELKDVLAEREADLEELKKLVLEREDEIVSNRERIAELEATQAETHDRLEETLMKIERDNEEKEADLIAANREVESLGQRVYDLEEGIDEMRAREAELNNELQRMDEDKIHLEEVVAALKEARRKLQDERDEFAMKVQRAEEAHKTDTEAWNSERAAEAEQHKRQLASRDQVHERLTAELEAARERVAMKDADLVSVQNLLRSVEDQHRKLGDERSSDQRSLELEIDRLKRDLSQYEEELERARDELLQRESALHARDLEVAHLMDDKRDIESKLTTERQGRLTLSDKLDAMTKTARQHEREATSLREQLSSTKPRISEMQHSRSAAQRDAERQKQERSDLLVRVLKDVDRFLGVEDNVSPNNFAAFKETLIQRLRSINGARADLDSRVKELEHRLEQRLNSLKRQVDGKWHALDGFEATVKKLELQRSQWRSRMSLKDGELDAARSRCAELTKELQLAQAAAESVNPDAADVSASQLRTITERAQAAERRATSATKDVAQLEERLTELQSRTQRAEAKWEARVKEYENRLRMAHEKVKAEKQGGKERAQQLEAQVRELERQVGVMKQHNRRAEDVVAHAAHLMDK